MKTSGEQDDEFKDICANHPNQKVSVYDIPNGQLLCFMCAQGQNFQPGQTISADQFRKVVIDEQTKIRQKFIVANISFKSKATEHGNLWKKIYLEKASRDIQSEFPKAQALLGHYSNH